MAARQRGRNMNMNMNMNMTTTNSGRPPRWNRPAAASSWAASSPVASSQSRRRPPAPPPGPDEQHGHRCEPRRSEGAQRAHKCARVRLCHCGRACACGADARERQHAVGSATVLARCGCVRQSGLACAGAVPASARDAAAPGGRALGSKRERSGKRTFRFGAGLLPPLALLPLLAAPAFPNSLASFAASSSGSNPCCRSHRCAISLSGRCLCKLS